MSKKTCLAVVIVALACTLIGVAARTHFGAIDAKQRSFIVETWNLGGIVSGANAAIRRGSVPPPWWKLDVRIGTGWKGGDNSLEVLKGIVMLRVLYLGDDLRRNEPGITDVGMRHVGELSNLEKLYIYDIPITDESILHLTRLKNLRHISITGSRITPAGIQRLRDALPNTTVRVQDKFKTTSALQ